MLTSTTEIYPHHARLEPVVEEQPYLHITSASKIRGHDIHGDGEFGASRGSRKHKGIDLVCEGGTMIMSACDGTVTRCQGVVYSDPALANWHYVEITDKDKVRNRYFYVQQWNIELGLFVRKGEPIGVAQGIEEQYPGITPHIHYEVMKGRRNYLDPVKYLKAQA